MNKALQMPMLCSPIISKEVNGEQRLNSLGKGACHYKKDSLAG